MDSGFSLGLVSLLVGVTSGLLTSTLLTGHALVLISDHASMVSLALAGLVLEHTTHAEDGLVLLGVVLLLLFLGVLGSLLLTELLGGPLLLKLSVSQHALVVH